MYHAKRTKPNSPPLSIETLAQKHKKAPTPFLMASNCFNSPLRKFIHFYNLFRVMLQAPTIQQKFYKVPQTFIPLRPQRNTKRKKPVKLFRPFILLRTIIDLHCAINIRFILFTKQKCTTWYIFVKSVQYCPHLHKNVQCKSYIDSST